MRIGTGVLEMVNNDQQAEQAAIRAYNDAIGLAHQVADQFGLSGLGTQEARRHSRMHNKRSHI